MVNAIGVKTQAEQFNALELLKGKMSGLSEKKTSQDVKVSGESLQQKIASIKDRLDRPEEVRSSFSKVPAEALSDKFVKASAEALSDKFSKGKSSQKALYNGTAEPLKIRMAGGERKKLSSAKPEDSDDVKRKDNESDEKKSKEKKETEKLGIMETELDCKEDHVHNSSCPKRIISYREEEVPKQ